MTQSAAPVVSQERFLERALLRMGGKFSWVSDPELRTQRFRRSIIDGYLDQAFAGKKVDGGMETFGQLFTRIFNQPLFTRGAQSATKQGEIEMQNTVELGS